MRRRARPSIQPGVKLIAPGRCDAAKDSGDRASTSTKSSARSIISRKLSRPISATPRTA